MSFDQLYSKFGDNFKNLSADIEHIDNKIDEIQIRIQELEFQLDHLKVTISNLGGVDKIKSYSVYNELLRILPFYYNNLSTLMDLKQKYRNQENDLTFKSVRLIEIECRKIDNLEEVDNDRVLKQLNTIDVDIDEMKYQI